MSMEVIVEHDPDSAFRLDHYYSFVHFDPLAGDVAPLRIPIFSNIAFRSRQLLRHRTREQLDYGLATLNWMITQINISQHSPVINLLLELDNRAAFGEDIGKDDYTLPTEVNTLNRCMETFEVAGQENYPDAEWSEYFAILALAKIDLAFDFDPESSEPEQEQFLLHVGGFGIEAMEAIRSGEMIKESDAVNKNLKNEIKELTERVSLRNKSAAIKRHEKTNQLLGELVAFYNVSDFSTYAEATHKFLESIPEERVAHLAPTNRLRTLSEGLSAIKHGKRRCN